MPAPPSRFVAAVLPPSFRLEYCFVIRKTLRSVTTGASAAHCAPLPRLEIYSFCSSTTRIDTCCYRQITSRFPMHDSPRYHQSPVSGQSTRCSVQVLYCKYRHVWMGCLSAQPTSAFHSTLHGSSSKLLDSRHNRKRVKNKTPNQCDTIGKEALLHSEPCAHAFVRSYTVRQGQCNKRTLYRGSGSVRLHYCSAY